MTLKNVAAEFDSEVGGTSIIADLILQSVQSANEDYCIEISKNSQLNLSDKEKDSCKSISYCKLEKDQINLEKICERILGNMQIPNFDCKQMSDIKVGKCKLRGWMIAIIVLIVLAVVGIGIGILLCVVFKIVCCK